MKILVINPIMYTSETNNITRAVSIKDTMMYDFCLAFHEMGHEVVLAGGEPYRPQKQEEYPFEVLWWKCSGQKLFMPHRFPYMPETRKYIRQNKNEFDLIISSEVFSINSLMAYRNAPDKVIIWHELAKHNAMLKKIPSKIWYNFIARLFMRNVRVVARSNEAKSFIQQYCKNTEDQIIDHGVNLDKFQASREKNNSFVVCSQLIGRKRIDGILRKFAAYLECFDSQAHLYIIGSGELENQLKKLANDLKIRNNVTFTGQLRHNELLPLLSKAKALLVNTVKDNNMVSIVESIAVGTPIVTTDVPLNSEYIKKYRLGIAKKEWNEIDLHEIAECNGIFVNNCMDYRDNLSTKKRVEQFIDLAKN